MPGMHEIWVLSLGWEDPWRRAWLLSPVFLLGESPWTEEPGGLVYGSHRVGHHRATKTSRAVVKWTSELLAKEGRALKLYKYGLFLPNHAIKLNKQTKKNHIE